MPRRTRFAGLWNAEQFEAAMRAHAAYLKQHGQQSIAVHTRAALAAVLVDGQPIEAAAVAAGLTRQRLFRRLSELVRQQLPEGWEMAVICLPRAELAKVREIEQRERERYRAAQEGQET